jgi:hypothetical protein
MTTRRKAGQQTEKSVLSLWKVISLISEVILKTNVSFAITAVAPECFGLSIGSRYNC